jgi:hypothetical protein
MLGDWCSIEPFCPGSSDACLKSPGWLKGMGDATTSFYFLQDLEAMVGLATALGKPADAAKYGGMLAKARVAYHGLYFNSTSNDFGPTQTGNTLGILAVAPVVGAAGVPAADVKGAVAALLKNIKGRGGKIATGAVGARWILQVPCCVLRAAHSCTTAER